LKYGGVKGGWESIYEVQGRVRKKFVRRPKNAAKGAAELELCSECRRGKKLCTVHSAVKLGTGLFNGKRPIDKMLLRVAERDLK